MIMKVVVLAGGLSTERDVSIISGTKSGVKHPCQRTQGDFAGCFFRLSEGT